MQLGFFFHMQQALSGSRAMLTWPLLFAISFMLIFSVVIALFKDLPDIEGDSQVALLQLAEYGIDLVLQPTVHVKL